MKIKPNYSELEREYGISRQTISKYDNGYAGKSKTRFKKSVFDKYSDEIREKFAIKGVTIKSLYMYLANRYNDFGKESNFRKYVEKNNLKPEKLKKPHPRYQTKRGQQLQVDWKEDIEMISKHGEIFKFNILTTTLSFSRLHNFEYSRTKSREDLIRCLIETFKYINGIPEHMLFDNMSTVIDINTKKLNTEFSEFVKDMGSKIRLCRPRMPETKGKDESANRFIAWLKPYNHEFEDENELVKIIENMRDQVNLEKNQTTMVEPILLFEKEKEYLKPLPCMKVLESYKNNRIKVKVNEDFMIYFKGKRYSVPCKYINQYVAVEQIENKLQIYFNRELIMLHTIAEKNNKNIIYNESHYIEGFRNILPYLSDNEIERRAKENLEAFEDLHNATVDIIKQK